MIPIDYSLLGSSLRYYIDLGYQYVEAPWVCGLDTIKQTCPNESKILKCSTQTGLVGSAEQGLLEMVSWGNIFDNPVVACGPCFRLGEPDTPYHQDHFMKIELGVMANSIEYAELCCKNFIRDAVGLFSQYTDVTVVPTDDGFDCEVNGIEIGSYGVRKIDQGYWVYGTGLALPRFSQTVNVK
jgi:hypothetical protein